MRPITLSFSGLRRKTPFFSSRLISQRPLSSTPSNSFYITTPIYYVNGPPHIGHAYTSILCDIMARSERLKKSREVFFLTGTDEHGLKILQKANSLNIEPIQLADQNSKEFNRLLNILSISNDEFIRTTQPRHKSFVDLFWRKLESNGDIYKGSYTGWYSVQDEAYYNEDEVEEKEIENYETITTHDGSKSKKKTTKTVRYAKESGSSVIWMEEESYFFRLSKYEDKLLQYIEDHPDFILPVERKKDIVSFIHEQRALRKPNEKDQPGLKDLSISRTNFDWGISVPNDSSHVIYVWLDALTNYLSALPVDALSSVDEINPEKFEKFWPANVHVVGKDILRFHALYWPAFLLSAGLPLPKHILAHGWWTIDGIKMSKSLGNILDPIQLSQQYSSDYLRFYLSSEILLGKDGSFNFSKFQEKINSFLVNDIGNLYRRLFVFLDRESLAKGLADIRGESFHKVKMIDTDELISIIKEDTEEVEHQIYLNQRDIQLLTQAHQSSKKIFSSMEDFQIKNAIDEIIKLSTACNKYMEEEAPWNLMKHHKKWIKEKKKSDPNFNEKIINNTEDNFSSHFHRFEQVMIALLEVCRIINLHLETVTPTTCQRFSTQSFNIPTPFLQYLPNSALPSSEENNIKPTLPSFIFSLKVVDPTALFPKLELLPEHQEKKKE